MGSGQRRRRSPRGEPPPVDLHAGQPRAAQGLRTRLGSSPALPRVRAREATRRAAPRSAAGAGRGWSGLLPGPTSRSTAPGSARSAASPAAKRTGRAGARPSSRDRWPRSAVIQVPVTFETKGSAARRRLDARRARAREGLGGRRHHRRVEGVGGVEPARRATPPRRAPRSRASIASVRARRRRSRSRPLTAASRATPPPARRRAASGLLAPAATGEHGAPGQLRHQPAAGGDQGEGVLEREDAGQAGGHVLADRVAEQGRTAHAPARPERGPGRTRRRTGPAGPAAVSAGRRRRPASGQDAPEVAAARAGRGPAGAAGGSRRTVEPLAEGRLAPVEARRHAGVLGPLARRTGRRPAAGRRPGGARRPRRSARVRAATGLRRVAGDHGPPVREGLRPTWRVWATSASAAPGAPPGGRPGRRWPPPGPRGCGPRGPGAAAGPRRRRRRRAARGGASSRIAWALVPPKPKELTPARRGAAPGSPRRPGAGRSATRNGAAAKSISGFGRLEVDGSAGSSPCSSARTVLISPAIAGGGVQVAEVALDRAEGAEAGPVRRRRRRPGSGRGPRSGRPAACRCRGPRRSDASPARPRRCPGPRRSRPPGRRRSGAVKLALCGAVVVDRRAQDHRPDRVAVGQGVLQPLERPPRRRRSRRRCPRPRRRTGGSGRRAERCPPAGGRSPALRHLDRHAAGERQVALAEQQALARQVDRHQGGRAGGLDG